MTAWAVLAALACLGAWGQGDGLAGGFVDPPDSARPWVYWFFMDGNLSKAGMTADLEAMAKAGIGGVIIMEVNVGIPRGPVAFMSEEWRALFRHAVEEAERLGLAITLNAGPGWTGSGGPWVKAEQSMQHLAASAVEVDGPARFDQVLPVPEPRKPYFGEQHLTRETAEARLAFYADEVVLAVPRTAGSGIGDIDEKALYVRDPYTSRPGVKPYLPAPAEYETAPETAVIPVDAVVDLTDRLAAGGRLRWEVPEGAWTILRFGRRTTGANTRPAPEPGLGFESDKFDRAALEAHFDAFVGALLDAVGPRPKNRTTGWTMLHIDSWEMGAQNWTAGFAQEFAARRGYDPRPYLPAMTGRVVGSLEISERFLWDLRLTAQELVIERHAQHLKALGRRHGFGLSIEPYDMNPTADLVLGGVADVPMCEFWSQGYGFDSAFTCHEAASVAHTLGRPVVAAEAFTANSHEAWRLYPAAMKDQGDWALCTGINRIVFHRFAHQPWLDRCPGMTMGPYGVHWDRTQTWWPMAGAYHGYLARCQFLLRQGVPVADVCYLTPEGAPHVFRPPPSALAGDLGDRRGYNFDGCAPGTLLEGARVEDGRVVLPSGAAYRLLVLPAFDTMTPGLLEKVAALAEAGATVVGPPPRKSPSLSGYPECDEKVRALAEKVWGDLEPCAKVREHAIGRGRVVWGGDFAPGQPLQAAPPIADKAQWIWFPEGHPAAAAAPGTRHFRRVFTLPVGKQAVSARLSATADNAFLLYVNGVLALQGDNFHRVYEADVRKLLNPGANVLAVRARNDGESPNPAGLIAALRVEYAGGPCVEVVSDAAWCTALEAAGPWRTATAALAGWQAVHALGPWDMAPWHLSAPPEGLPHLYPPYEATARLLAEMGAPPDFESEGRVRYAHRRTEAGDVYFVANRSDADLETACLFRVAGRKPELWDPVWGTMRPLRTFRVAGGRTEIPLVFAPHQSYFVLFREAFAFKDEASDDENFAAPRAAGQVTGPWEVVFDPALGGPGKVHFDVLHDWREDADPRIQHYSGIATYSTALEPPKPSGEKDLRFWLDIGPVPGMARVRLNGQDLGVVWCAPWRVELTGAVHAGANRLEIEVANRWPNRLIGDQALPSEERVAWTTWNPYKADSPLLESGLLGPVRFLTSPPDRL